MNQPERRKVSIGLRQKVLDALVQRNFFIFRDGRLYLEDVGFNPAEFIVKHLIAYLREDKALYVLPENTSKCQCCLAYEDDLVIHVKLVLKEDSGGFFVALGFHSHNTGHPPLPP